MQDEALVRTFEEEVKLTMNRHRGVMARLALNDTLNIVKYDSDNLMQLAHMETLIESRHMDLSLLKELPKLGYLALDGNTIVAAGFLRHSESKAVILDSLITNACLPGDTRNFVLDLLVKNLIKLAQVNDYTQIIAMTADKNTLERAMSHGFEVLPHTVIGLRLTGE